MSSYESIIKNRLERYRANPDNTITLGIETSCDDTSAALLRGKTEVLSMCTNSQIKLHQEFGGVVPELASRDHVRNLYPVVSEALKMAGLKPEDIDAIAVTNRPGLLGSLLTGVNFAKGMAYSLGIPFIGVNHIYGHIMANYLSAPDLTPPFLCLIASGGHTQVAQVNSNCNYEILGGTCDDAAGEALDKIARALGLPYPGGPHLERIAEDGNEHAYNFRSQFNERNSLELSFSGIKTAAINAMNASEIKGDFRIADVAASFQSSVINALVSKLILAGEMTRIPKIAIAGGVSSNGLLRKRLEDEARAHGLDFYCPDKKYCTDNAAMIACAGRLVLMENDPSPLSLDAYAVD